MYRFWFVLSLLAACGDLRADLSAVKAEPNLEKRSQLALDYANTAIDEAKKAYSDASAEFPNRISDVRESVELSYEALQDTGKSARRNPKYFKRAELRMRALVNRLTNLEKEVSLEDRAAVEAAKKRIEELHEQVLLEIMSKK